MQKSFLDKSVILGGSLVLKANSVLLSCFHGSNFRAQTWALFSINEPVVRFQSEVFSVEKSCQIERAFSKQEISFKLGFDEEKKESSENAGKNELLFFRKLRPYDWCTKIQYQSSLSKVQQRQQQQQNAGIYS